MSRGRQLLIVLASVLALSSALSHAIVRVLDIRTSAIDRGRINADAPGQPALVLGSSLTFFGISFRAVGKAMDRPLVTPSVGGCSPCELKWLALVAGAHLCVSKDGNWISWIVEKPMPIRAIAYTILLMTILCLGARESAYFQF